MSKEELDKTIPVSPPMVNRKINPNDHRTEAFRVSRVPWKVPSHLKTLIPVGTAIIIVALVK